MRIFFTTTLAVGLCSIIQTPAANLRIPTSYEATSLDPQSLDVTRKPIRESLHSAITNELQRVGSRVSSDRFATGARLRQLRQASELGYNNGEKMNSIGASLFGDIAGDTANEVAVRMLPLEDWEDFGKSVWRGFVVKFVEGSFGNTAEKDLSTISDSPTLAEYDLTQSDEAVHHFGLRLRREPYLYIQNGLGWAPTDDERRTRLFNTEVRCYSPFLTDDPTNMRVEALVGIYIHDSVRLVAGTACHPLHFNALGSRPTAMMRLERRTPNSIVHIGVSSNDRETLVSAGLHVAF